MTRELKTISNYEDAGPSLRFQGRVDLKGGRTIAFHLPQARSGTILPQTGRIKHYFLGTPRGREIASNRGITRPIPTFANN